MERRNSSELYGADSIRDMNGRNRTKAVIWIVIQVICFVMLRYLVVRQYDRIGTPQSIEAFQMLLALELGCMIALSLLWWFITSAGWPQLAWIRSFIERNSRHSAAGFVLLAAACAGLLTQLGEAGIYNTNTHFHRLYCLFTLPAVFICLMYMAPPVQIQEVIIPGKRRGRLIAAGAAALAAGIPLKIDFF